MDDKIKFANHHFMLAFLQADTSHPQNTEQKDHNVRCCFPTSAFISFLPNSFYITSLHRHPVSGYIIYFSGGGGEYFTSVIKSNDLTVAVSAFNYFPTPCQIHSPTLSPLPLYMK